MSEIVQQIKEKMTIETVYNLLNEFNADPKIKEENVIIATTVCHKGDSHKLYYYQDGKNFTCFTNCGNMQVVDFVMNVLECDYSKAIIYLKKFFGISDFVIGNFIDSEETIENIVNPLDDISQSLHDRDDVLEKDIPTINNSIVNSFYNKYPVSWIREGITRKSMDKYNIKFDILNHRIIIPTYRSDGKLIGIRCRDVDENRLNSGMGKYYPIIYDGKVLRWPTGSSLYGLNVNKQSISSHKRVILFEGEKSVLKMDRYLGDNNISLALFGSNLTEIQKETILNLGVNEIIIALDKEFHEDYDEESKLYAKKIAAMVKNIKMRCRVSVIWDKHGILKYKDSPIDRGFDNFKSLLSERITL